MRNDEIRQLLASGKSTAVSFNPDVKDAITKKRLDDVVRDVRSTLAGKRAVHVIVVKE